MNLDIPQIEELLRSMRPTRIPADLRARIGSAITQATTHDPLQAAIASSRPSPLSPALSNRLEEALSRIPHPHSGKVVHFPATRKESTAPAAWKKWAVAAAVALMGATSALLVPHPPAGSHTQQASNTPAPQDSARTNSSPAINAGSLVPAGYRRGLSEAKDEGIVWQPQYGPHRRLKLVYRELVTLHDQTGRVYQVERPRVEYVLVPAKVD